MIVGTDVGHRNDVALMVSMFNKGHYALNANGGHNEGTWAYNKR